MPTDPPKKTCGNCRFARDECKWAAAYKQRMHKGPLSESAACQVWEAKRPHCEEDHAT